MDRKDDAAEKEFFCDGSGDVVSVADRGGKTRDYLGPEA